jgi:penicillin-insensitive murein endopeptidase
VGDLSRRGGGRIRPHRSHRRGIDVDVGAYLLEPDGTAPAVDERRFVEMDEAGVATDGSGRRFDVARNWAFIERLLSDPEARVQYVFVWNPLVELLLAHAERVGAAPEVIEAARLTVLQPRRGARHDNHFHIRIYCPPDDRPSCEDKPPYHPWYEPQAPSPSALGPLFMDAHPSG